jgi:hypothetical protein
MSATSARFRRHTISMSRNRKVRRPRPRTPPTSNTSATGGGSMISSHRRTGGLQPCMPAAAFPVCRRAASAA